MNVLWGDIRLILNWEITLRQLIIIIFSVCFYGNATASGFLFLKNSPIASFGKDDLALMKDSIYKALEQTKDGEQLAWENTKTGRSGVVNPLKTFKHKGMKCRTIEVVNRSKKDTSKSQFDFCEVEADSWKIIYKK